MLCIILSSVAEHFTVQVWHNYCTFYICLCRNRDIVHIPYIPGASCEIFNDMVDF